MRKKTEIEKTINNWVRKNEYYLTMISIHRRMYYKLLDITQSNLELINTEIKRKIDWMKEEEKYNGKETYNYGVLEGELQQFYKRRDEYEMIIKHLEFPKRYMKEEEKTK